MITDIYHMVSDEIRLLELVGNHDLPWFIFFLTSLWISNLGYKQYIHLNKHLKSKKI